MAKPKLLSRKEILEASDMPEPELLEVPEWGGAVLIRQISALEADRYNVACIDPQTGKLDPMRLAKQGVALAVMCIVDEEGNRLFTTMDIEKLGRKSGQALKRVVDRCREINDIALSEDDDDEALEGKDPALDDA